MSQIAHLKWTCVPQGLTTKFLSSYPSPELVSLVSGCFKPILGETGHVCISSIRNPGTSGQQSATSRLLENDRDCTRLANMPWLWYHIRLSSDSTFPATFDSTIQCMSTQGSPKLESSCLAPRATAFQKQHFSVRESRWHTRIKSAVTVLNFDLIL